jgi:methionine-rich copper-binding protein CopC
MKKVISALTAATMVASMSASVMSAFAVYGSSDIAFTMKVNPDSYYDVSGTITKTAQTAKFTVSEDGKTITFASAKDAAGAKFGVGAYIVADTANPSVQSVGGLVEVDGKNVHIQHDPSGDGQHGANPSKAVAGDTEATYTAKSGEFTADRFVSAFGYVDARKGTYGDNTSSITYVHSSEWSWADTYTGPEVLTWIWMYNMSGKGDGASKETAAFLGAKSDDFPVTEFTVELDKDIKDGTYTVNYGESFEHAQYGKTVSSFVNVGTKDVVVPASMEGITIVVGDAQPDTKETPTETKETPTETKETPTETKETPTETKETPTETKETPTETKETPTEQVEPSEASHDKGYEWDIADVEYTPKDMKKDEVDVDINVYNDPGTYGVQFKVLVNGKEISDPSCPFELYDVADGGGYAKIGTLQPNLDTGDIAISFNGEGNDKAADGTSAVQLQFVPKADATVETFVPGTVYKITFAADGYKFADFDKNVYSDIVLTAGSITIPGGEPVTEATETPTETKETPTETKETPTETKETPTETKETPTETKDTDAPAGDLLYGDVNQNKKVELVDIVMLNRYLTGYANQTLNETQMEVANCAGNKTKGTVDTKKADLTGADSVEILKYLIGLVASLPTA